MRAYTKTASAAYVIWVAHAHAEVSEGVQLGRLGLVGKEAGDPEVLQAIHL